MYIKITIILIVLLSNFFSKRYFSPVPPDSLGFGLNLVPCTMSQLGVVRSGTTLGRIESLCLGSALQRFWKGGGPCNWS